MIPMPDTIEVNQWKRRLAEVCLGIDLEIPLIIPPVSRDVQVDVGHADMLDHGNMGLDQIKGDGNCFYRCMSKEFFGTENYHDTLRQSTVLWLRANYLDHEAFVIEDMALQHKADGDWRSYLDTQLKPGAWAYTANCYGLAGLFGCEIQVLQYDYNGDSVWRTIAPMDIEKARYERPPTGYQPHIYNAQVNGQGQHFTRCFRNQFVLSQPES